ncbi:MAG TPA: carboxypeptidase-like regulatory domain-containing protein [Gemmatimonadales bacterium]
MGPADSPSPPPPNLIPSAFYLSIDVEQGVVTVVPPRTLTTQSADQTITSLAGAEIVGISTSNFYRSGIVSKKRTITFDLTLTNKLSVTDLVTPTFPKPPTGVQGILAFPYTVSATGVQGGKAVPNTDWNGNGTTKLGAPYNFFNDFASCGTAVSSDCYRWEMFPDPLKAGESSGPQKVGFTVDQGVTNVGVYLVVAADLVDHPPVPAPGLGAVTGSVTSPGIGALAGATVTLSPGGQSAVTDGLGKYLITGAAIGAFTAAVSTLPQSCAVSAVENGTITSGGVSTVDFSVACQLTTGGISGNASSPQLGPFASANIELLQMPGGSHVSSTTSDVAGDFSFSGLAPGAYAIRITGLAAPCPATGGPVNVSVSAGNTSTATLTVSCVATGSGSGMISGTVASAVLGPLPARLSILSSPSGATVSTQSDPSTGSYGPISIEAGQVTVTASGLPSICTQPLTVVGVAPGISTTADVALDCPGATIGRVFSPVLGPLAGVTVTIANQFLFSTSVQTNVDGYYSFPGSPGNGTGIPSLDIALSGLPSACTPPTPLNYTEQAKIDFSVDCTGSATGNLNLSVPVGIGGSTLPNVDVMLQGPSGYSQLISTGSTGVVQLPDLPIGSFTATISQLRTGCTPPLPQTFLISYGITTDVFITPACDPVLGQVISPTLGPLGGVSVFAFTIFGQLTTVTDASGNFSIDHSIVGPTGGVVSLSVTAGLPVSCVPPISVSAPAIIGPDVVMVTIPVDCN